MLSTSKKTVLPTSSLSRVVRHKNFESKNQYSETTNVPMGSAIITFDITLVSSYRLSIIITMPLTESLWTQFAVVPPA